MATILAYTSPALGHLFPFSALLSELSGRGHKIHLRTLSTGVEMGQRLGFTTDAIDPRIEAIVHDDWKASNTRAALKRAVDVFCRRAAHEVADFTDAVTRTRPDALIVDVNCWGALSAADAGDIPWASFSPYAGSAITWSTALRDGPGSTARRAGPSPRRRAATHRDGHDREGGFAGGQQDSRERRGAAGHVGG
jgi:UDP:flavonoid glycosyltransferase YjiC (YdhE family)